MKILVGSKNPVKINAVKEAFSKYYDNIEVIGFEVDSKVPDQPINEETFEGAKNRVDELKKINEEKNICAKYFVGIEGGIMQYNSRWYVFGGIHISDDLGKEGTGTSTHFEIPEYLAEELRDGTELGDIADRLTGEINTKHRGGIIDYFTKGRIDRKDYYIPGIVVALIPFMNEEIYFKNQ